MAQEIMGILSTEYPYMLADHPSSAPAQYGLAFVAVSLGW